MMISKAMTDAFTFMKAHGEFVRGPQRAGRLVLSHLPAGGSRIQTNSRSVKFVLQGEEVYEIDGRIKRIRPGEFMVLEGGSEARVSIRGVEPTIGLCVYSPSNESAISDLKDKCDLLPGAVVGCTAEPFAALLKEYARKLLDEPGAGPRLANRIMADASRGSIQFLKRFESKLDRLAGQRSAARIEILQRLERARAFIRDHDDRVIRLDEVARHASISRFHLTRLFAEVYGQPPLTYHRNLRLDESARRLKRGEASPSKISDDLGYSNPSGFTRAFIRRFGFPPSSLSPLPNTAALA